MAPLTDKMLSVVVPCYRDELNIRELYARLSATLQRITSSYEIIYVNDASPDNAGAVLDELAKGDPRLTVIHHARNFGLMNVYTLGMKQAIGAAVVLMDGDLEDPPELIEEFARQWLAGYLVVYGIHKERDVSWLKSRAFIAFYRTWNYLSDIRIPVDAGDFSLMDRKVVDIINDLPEKDRFLRGLRAWVGFPQIGVNFKRDKRFAGKSTQSYRSYFSWAILAITSFSTAPLRFVSIIAASTTVLSIANLVVLVALYFANVRGPRGWLTMIAVILALASVAFICLAIIAEYLTRIYKEVKQRPTSLVAEMRNDHRAGGL